MTEGVIAHEDGEFGQLTDMRQFHLELEGEQHRVSNLVYILHSNKPAGAYYNLASKSCPYIRHGRSSVIVGIFATTSLRLLLRPSPLLGFFLFLFLGLLLLLQCLLLLP